MTVYFTKGKQIFLQFLLICPYGLIFIMFLAAGCTPQQITAEQITIGIRVDGSSKEVTALPGISVMEAISQADIVLGNLDRVDPPGYTILTSSMTIQIVRVREEFTVVEENIPYEKLTVRNESLPEGQALLIQPGANGRRQFTYRQIYEDEKPGQKSIFKTEVLTEPQAEIVMVGVQTPFTAVPITGKIVYITAGNAWVMEDSTANRRPLLTSGDLDGRVFSLADDGNWLLFTRKSSNQTDINMLWALNITQEEAKPINLRVSNIIHFASWRPNNPLTLAYSTVEPRPTAPGWQANNDLYLLKINESGIIINQEEIISSNSGGIYGWWGTNYSWSPDGKSIAFARPDSLGLVDIENEELLPLASILPVQTKSDWAWVPGFSWSSDRKIIYSVFHQPMAGITNDESSPLFSLSAFILDDRQQIEMVNQTGMFAYPSVSPSQKTNRYLVAFLQAILPDRSDESRYRLMVMDRDGSNRRYLFPTEGSAGLEPQQVVWSPFGSNDRTAWIAATYQGNLWLIDANSGQSQQIIGDGSISRLDWK